MYRIVKKEALKPTVTLYEIEAPMVAKKARRAHKAHGGREIFCEPGALFASGGLFAPSLRPKGLSARAVSGRASGGLRAGDVQPARRGPPGPAPCFPLLHRLIPLHCSLSFFLL